MSERKGPWAGAKSCALVAVSGVVLTVVIGFLPSPTRQIGLLVVWSLVLVGFISIFKKHGLW